MTDVLYIDGINVFDAFGVFILDGGYGGLIQFPSLKKIAFNDWHEEDGIEADLSAPVLDSKEFDISFGCMDAVQADSMIVLLSDGSYHDFDFREAGCVRRLRMVSEPGKNTVINLGKFSLKFADDFPLSGYSYVPPVPVPSVWQNDYGLDDRLFSDYGVWVTEGSDDEILKMPSVKKNLLTSSDFSIGAVYDGRNVVFQSKDVTLRCTMRADSLLPFWSNYNALLYDLTRSGERSFYFAKTDEEYPFYYKSSQVGRFVIINGDVWCDFTLTLVFTSFRVGETEYILATEDGIFIETEDGQHFIRIK